MGMMPLSECRRRRRNEYPCPARIGCTPFNFWGLSLRSEGAAAVAIECWLSLSVQIAVPNLLLSFSIQSFVKERYCTSVMVIGNLPVQFAEILCEHDQVACWRKLKFLIRSMRWLPP